MNLQEIQSVKQRFGIIGSAPALNYAINVAMQVAATDLTVLITGESGSGKESFSKIIHSLSHRKHGQFIAINCGAIPEGTIDSELFGHEKGSFTGAVDQRKGYFETTNGGTIFLDEIGEMPIGTQARLLRVLENGEFIRVGSSKVMKTDVRVVAATNVNLMDAVEKGRFREDLYYRLNTVPIFVPPLRERGEDIELLFRKFTTDFAERYRIKPIQLTEPAKQMLLRYPFPGNIRQLKNMAEQISILESDHSRPVDTDVLGRYLPQQQPTSRMPVMVPSAAGSGSSENFNEREILYKVLFDLRRDMTDLKKLVLEVLGNEQYGRQILNNHKELFDTLQSDTYVPSAEPSETHVAKLLPAVETIENYNDLDEDEEITIEDISHETEDDDSLSLEKKEKEMIVKALRRNNNKRKYAAQALGISERTLYRKIKQYQIDEE
ncbi:sigma-54 interaction domain-containing protein [Arsenicibacter rosenii]|uniref:Sigma-54-dependent Fis family transcriptional regulator n=1 Tax=Arsenicibacter rosenii TaxID=1750698 RepID=A0A1S2VS03_9BACT|nr:sigma-54 dependent transcriptional regulator [Arsenicibacter rosenii]OIN61095.1 sigma-54-dependent Fis family transcriptional regulator [Arsenicibacter rosenii]